MKVTFGGKAEPDCPVCGGERILTRICRDRDCLWNGREHLHRRCGGCGYGWLEEQES